MAQLYIRPGQTSETGTYVKDAHFGANALHSVNTDGIDFSPSEGFQSAIERVDINHLRYPGGTVESSLDVTRLENGQVRAEVAAFLDWCLEKQQAGEDIKVTIVLPTKTDITKAQIEDFVYKVLKEYGSVIEAFEIGNEYSIGPYDAHADRSEHPEDDPDADFAYSQNETEYGIAANRVINATQDALDRLSAENPLGAPDPRILIQMAETNGAGSSYKNGGDYDGANQEILAWLDHRAMDAIDGVVAHYYYNQDHVDDPAFDHDWQETRRLDERYDNFIDHLGRDVPMVITEWNVLVGNNNQTGMASASVLLEMFEFMVRTDVSGAHIWPLQHRTINSIMGDRADSTADPSISGTAFSMMSDTLRPVDSETGISEQFQSMTGTWIGASNDLEVNQYQSQYHDVIYVSSRVLEEASVTVDLSQFATNAIDITVRQLTMDRDSSDGLSDFADEQGLNRIARRYVDPEEMDLLRTLPFFDENNPNHLTTDANGNFRTYLPTYWGIIPLVGNPQSIDDYYFATEADVTPAIEPIEISSNYAQLELMPYDIVEIVVEHSWHQEGGDGWDRLIGGVGVDVILGRGGDDLIRGGEGGDTLKGGNGNDTIDGGSDRDFLNGGNGNDVLHGGDGHDMIRPGAGDDTINGGSGSDQVFYSLDSSEVSLVDMIGNRATLASAEGIDVIENVEFISFNGQFFPFATLSLLTGLPVLLGTTSGDTLVSSNDSSEVHADLGDDTVETGDGHDTIYGDDGDDWITAGRGRDLVEGGNGDDIMRGLGGGDTLDGGGGADLILGGRAADLIDGGGGHDRLNGQHGNDILRGGEGNDTLLGGGGRDKLYGGDDADLMKGGGAADLLKGQFGNDTLIGNNQDDTLIGGWGRDVLRGGPGDDVLDGGFDDDRLFGGSGADVFIFGAGQDTIGDFDIHDDMLQIDSSVADGRSVRDLVSTATLTGDGLTLDFGHGDSVLLRGVYSTSGLEAVIEIA